MKQEQFKQEDESVKFHPALNQFLSEVGGELVVNESDLIGFWVSEGNKAAAHSFLKSRGYTEEGQDSGFPAETGFFTWVCVDSSCLTRVLLKPEDFDSAG